MRALVIDDSRAMRTILGSMLKKEGFEVAQAGDGRQGLRHFDDGGNADVILVDWNMPEMDGLTFVREFRARTQYGHVPVLVVTTETEIERVTAALEAGANEYVMKPFNAEVIRDKLSLLGVLPA